MLKTVLFVWLLIPFGVGLYHYGPGQEKLLIDQAEAAAARADASAALARETAGPEGTGGPDDEGAVAP